MTAMQSLQSHRTTNRDESIRRYRELVHVAVRDEHVDAAEVDQLLRALQLTPKHYQHDLSVVRSVVEKEQAAANHTGERDYAAARHRLNELTARIDEARAAVARAEPNRDGRRRLETQVRRLKSTNPRIYGNA